MIRAPGRRSTGRSGAWQGPLVASMLILGPAVLTLGTAFGVISVDGSDAGGASTSNFSAVFGATDFLSSVGTTLVLALLGVLLAVVGGTGLAVMTTKLRIPGTDSRWLKWLPTLSFLLPSVLIFLAWHILYSDRVGLVNIVLRAVPGVGGGDLGPLNITTAPFLVAAMAVFLLPFVFIPVRGALQSSAPELEQAALTCGASWPRVLRTVTLPMVRSAVAAAGLLAFVLGLGAYVVPATIRIPGLSTLSLNIKESLLGLKPLYGQAAVWSLTLLVLCLVGLAIRRRLVGAGRDSLPLRSSTPTRGGQRMEIGRWRWVALFLFATYGLFAGLLPLFGVVTLSMRPFWSTNFSQESFNLDNYRNLGQAAPLSYASLTNATMTAVVGATVGVIIGLWFARRVMRGGAGGAFVEVMTFVPAGIPPVIIGLSFLIFSLRILPASYATLLPPLLAYLVILLPFCVQIPLAALRRIPHELESASSVFGASKAMTTRRIVFPMLVPELLALWTMLMVVMVREVEAAVLLTSPSFPLAGPQMMAIWTDDAPSAAAFGILLLAVTIGLGLVGLGAVGAYKLNRRLSVWRCLRHVPDRGSPKPSGAVVPALGSIATGVSSSVEVR